MASCEGATTIPTNDLSCFDRAYARADRDKSFVGIVVAPSHEAIDAVLAGTTAFLNDWRETEDGLTDLQITRILPATPPTDGDRVDAQTTAVDVTYANYNSPSGKATLHELADDIFDSTSPSAAASQHLLFATPATLYRTLETIASRRSEIAGDSAPAAMRHSPGLADVVCVDEASMMNISQWLLAGSALKPTGQTLVVGDHRQLNVVTETDWTDTLRKPLTETKAYLSALEYVHYLNGTMPDNREPADTTASHSTDGGSRTVDTQQPSVTESTTEQSVLPGFSDSTQEPTHHDGGNQQ